MGSRGDNHLARSWATHGDFGGCLGTPWASLWMDSKRLRRRRLICCLGNGFRWPVGRFSARSWATLEDFGGLFGDSLGIVLDGLETSTA